MKNNIKLDAFHIQVVAHYFKLKSDFINIIQVRKQFQYVLDCFRINPIPITKHTKNLFKYIDTQQFFWKYSINEHKIMRENEIELPHSKILQYNAEISYSDYLQIIKKKKISGKQMKFKALTYTKEDREKYGNRIPKEVKILGNECFEYQDISKITIPKNVTKLGFGCFACCKDLEDIKITNNVISIDSSCFSNCFYLSHIHLSTNLTKLNFDTFGNNSSLETINLPPYLREIDCHCFR